MKKFFILFLLSIFLMLILTACGGSSDYENAARQCVQGNAKACEVKAGFENWWLTLEEKAKADKAEKVANDGLTKLIETWKNGGEVSTESEELPEIDSEFTEGGE